MSRRRYQSTPFLQGLRLALVLVAIFYLLVLLWWL
jgi:hypothetical protein